MLGPLSLGSESLFTWFGSFQFYVIFPIQYSSSEFSKSFNFHDSHLQICETKRQSFSSAVILDEQPKMISGLSHSSPGALCQLNGNPSPFCQWYTSVWLRRKLFSWKFGQWSFWFKWFFILNNNMGPYTLDTQSEVNSASFSYHVLKGTVILNPGEAIQFHNPQN